MTEITLRLNPCPKIRKKMIYMGNLTFNQLTPAHKKYLKSKGYWDAIIAKKFDFQNGTISYFLVCELFFSSEMVGI